jgi:hypothetical protein
MKLTSLIVVLIFLAAPLAIAQTSMSASAGGVNQHTLEKICGKEAVRVSKLALNSGNRNRSKGNTDFHRASPYTHSVFPRVVRQRRFSTAAFPRVPPLACRHHEPPAKIVRLLTTSHRRSIIRDGLGLFLSQSAMIGLRVLVSQ